MTDAIDATGADAGKRAAAVAAAAQVRDGMAVGLGTGSTVARFLPALAARGLRLRCVATSAATETEAGELGIAVEPFGGALDRLDLAVDGADQVSPDLWLVKGGGGAHTREKIVAAAAARFPASAPVASIASVTPALYPAPGTRVPRVRPPNLFGARAIGFGPYPRRRRI